MKQTSLENISSVLTSLIYLIPTDLVPQTHEGFVYVPALK